MELKIIIQNFLEIKWRVIVESASVNHRQKKMGYNAAKELYKRVTDNLMKQNDEEE